MSDFLGIMEQCMVLRGFSPGTKENYLRQVRFFLAYCRQPVELLSEKNIRDYLHYLISNKNASYSTVDIACSALKFYFEFCLHQQLSEIIFFSKPDYH